MAQRALASWTAGEAGSPTSADDKALPINMYNDENTPLLGSRKEGDSEGDVARPRKRATYTHNLHTHTAGLLRSGYWQ